VASRSTDAVLGPRRPSNAPSVMPGPSLHCVIQACGTAQQIGEDQVRCSALVEFACHVRHANTALPLRLGAAFLLKLIRAPRRLGTGPSPSAQRAVSRGPLPAAHRVVITVCRPYARLSLFSSRAGRLVLAILSRVRRRFFARQLLQGGSSASDHFLGGILSHCRSPLGLLMPRALCAFVSSTRWPLHRLGFGVRASGASTSVQSLRR